MIDGKMADRATDRINRVALKTAFALGKLDGATAGSIEKTWMAISVCAGMPVHLPRNPKLLAISASRRHSSRAAFSAWGPFVG